MSTVSKEDLAGQVISDRSQVVILGAGASRATCPNGDANRKTLPLMNDLVDCLGLRPKLVDWNIDVAQNFEDIFSKLFDLQENDRTNELQQDIRNYFSVLKLPNTPTIYDYLVLSLRETDLIASFNWDPLLLQAYKRNSNQGIELPRLAFLHGNVMVASCKEHNRVNYVGEVCKQCHKRLEPVDLLYPITKKNYTQSQVIKIQWKRLERHLKQAFQFTIFGYSGPKTDTEAICMMKKAWMERNKDNILIDTQVITPHTEAEVYEHWKPFVHSHYVSVVDDFYKSNIAQYPRRGIERSWQNNIEAHFVEENPIPRNLDFPDLWRWYHQFVKAEKEYRRKNTIQTSQMVPDKK